MGIPFTKLVIAIWHIDGVEEKIS